MFAYCENDPINKSDPTGEFWATVAKMAVGAVIGVTTYTVGQLIAGEPIDAGNLALSAGEGALTAISGTVVGTVISGVSSFVKSYRSGNDFKTVLMDTAIGVGSSLVGSVGRFAGGKIKLSEFKNTATKKELKALGNSIMGKHGNQYKSLDKWVGELNRRATRHFMDSKYASYLNYLLGTGASISVSFARRPR